jgi:hypothetical protein
VAARGFSRPGANVIFVAARRMIFCGGASSDLFYFAIRFFGSKSECLVYRAVTGTPLDWYQQQQQFFTTLFWRPLPLAPGGHCPPDPLAPPLLIMVIFQYGLEFRNMNLSPNKNLNLLIHNHQYEMHHVWVNLKLLQVHRSLALAKLLSHYFYDTSGIRLMPMFRG